MNKKYLWKIMLDGVFHREFTVVTPKYDISLAAAAAEKHIENVKTFEDKSIHSIIYIGEAIG